MSSDSLASSSEAKGNNASKSDYDSIPIESFISSNLVSSAKQYNSLSPGMNSSKSRAVKNTFESKWNC